MTNDVLFFLLLIFVSTSDAGCPRATFEFFNQSIKASYNFIDSSVGNIGSIETCPYTGRPYVYLPCYPNSTWGNEPYFSNCLQPNRLSLVSTSPATSRLINFTIDQLDQVSQVVTDVALFLLKPTFDQLICFTY